MSRRFLMFLLVAGTLLSLLFSALPLSAAPTSDAGSWRISRIGPQTAEMASAIPPGRDELASRRGAEAPSRATRPVPSTPVAPPGAATGKTPNAPEPAREIPTLPTTLPNGAPVKFAGLTNLQLRLPPHVALIGFHESGSRSALPLHPVGAPRNNDNMSRLLSAPVSEGPDYVIMRTRNRRQSPTTAVDLAMPFNRPFISPVSGTVVQAGSYLLYGREPDNIVVISPNARPDLLMVILHTNGVRVAEGQRVVAGETVIALTARRLTFDSQIESYAGRLPHVHIEFRPA